MTEDNGDDQEDPPCVFHGRVYPAHDFFYGPKCRRCGVWSDEVSATPDHWTA